MDGAPATTDANVSLLQRCRPRGDHTQTDLRLEKGDIRISIELY